MNLATRCTACGTIFRVVQDQLKVSEGWVRCGRCQAVFNAEESLFDLERDSPPPWQPAEQPVDLNDVAESTGATQSNAEPVEVARVSRFQAGGCGQEGKKVIVDRGSAFA